MASNKRRRQGGPPPGDQKAARKRARLRQRLTRAAIVIFIVGGLGAWIFMPRQGSYSAGGTGATIEGVQRFLNTPGHTLDPVTYAQSPPAGGVHHPTWLNCGIYDQPVPNVYAVHALEHGAVWVTYRPDIGAEALATLRGHLPSSYVVLSPYAGLPSPIVLSAWNAQLRLESPDDPRLPQFFEEYWRNQNVPEPGALCTGGLDGPGRAS
jgi:hypothetical protein